MKNKLNMLNIDNSDKKDLIWIIESQSSDSFDIDILTSSESNYRSASESSDIPLIFFIYIYKNKYTF